MAGCFDSGTRKIPALILSLLLSAVVLFSAFYIVAEAQHECSGEDCPICVCIHQCERTLRQIGQGIVYFAAVFAAAVLTFLLAFSPVDSFLRKTPVSIKVRLND